MALWWSILSSRHQGLQYQFLFPKDTWFVSCRLTKSPIESIYKWLARKIITENLLRSKLHNWLLFKMGEIWNCPPKIYIMFSYTFAEWLALAKSSSPFVLSFLYVKVRAKRRIRLPRWVAVTLRFFNRKNSCLTHDFFTIKASKEENFILEKEASRMSLECERVITFKFEIFVKPRLHVQNFNIIIAPSRVFWVTTAICNYPVLKQSWGVRTSACKLRIRYLFPE